MESFLLPRVAIGVSLIAEGARSVPRLGGQPWPSAVTLPHGRNGLSARRMTVLSTCHEPSLWRQVHRELLRSVVLDVTPIISATACHQRNYLERYSRFIVVLLNRKNPAKPRFIILGSTDPELNGHKLIDLYAARFQIEFLFRDSKQFTGLLDCQARAAAALDFHFNASLATLNLVRAEDLGMQQGQEPHVFSMASWKQCQFNERLLDLFMENLALDPTWVKNHSCYQRLSGNMTWQNHSLLA